MRSQADLFLTQTCPRTIQNSWMHGCSCLVSSNKDIFMTFETSRHRPDKSCIATTIACKLFQLSLFCKVLLQTLLTHVKAFISLSRVQQQLTECMTDSGHWSVTQLGWCKQNETIRSTQTVCASECYWITTSQCNGMGLLKKILKYIFSSWIIKTHNARPLWQGTVLASRSQKLKLITNTYSEENEEFWAKWPP